MWQSGNDSKTEYTRNIIQSAVFCIQSAGHLFLISLNTLLSIMRIRCSHSLFHSFVTFTLNEYWIANSSNKQVKNIKRFLNAKMQQMIIYEPLGCLHMADILYRKQVPSRFEVHVGKSSNSIYQFSCFHRVWEVICFSTIRTNNKV